MSLIAPAVELAGPPDGKGDYLTRLEQASITKSLDNLLTFPYVAKAVRGGELFLHGAYFDVANGRMFVRNEAGYAEIADEDLVSVATA
jgi:carbonic anhydrase